MHEEMESSDSYLNIVSIAHSYLSGAFYILLSYVMIL